MRTSENLNSYFHISKFQKPEVWKPENLKSYFRFSNSKNKIWKLENLNSILKFSNFWFLKFENLKIGIQVKLSDPFSPNLLCNAKYENWKTWKYKFWLLDFWNQKFENLSSSLHVFKIQTQNLKTWKSEVRFFRFPVSGSLKSEIK